MRKYCWLKEGDVHLTEAAPRCAEGMVPASAVALMPQHSSLSWIFVVSMLLESYKLFVILRSRPSLPGEGHWSLTQATRMATFSPVWQTGVLSHLLNLISALIQTFITTSIYNFHISFKYSSRKRCKELELGAIRRVLIWFLPTGEFQRRKKHPWKHGMQIAQHAQSPDTSWVLIYLKLMIL